MSNIALERGNTDTSHDGVPSGKRDLCAKSAWIMIMCLASTGGAGHEVWIGIGGANQRSSGTITLPRPSEVRCGGRGRRGDIEGVHRIDEIADFIYEVLDPPDQGSLP